VSPRERDSVGTFEDLHAAATRACGLSDFGPEEYVEPLRVLLAAYESTAGLTPYGNAETRGWVRGALTARLLSEAAFHRTPEVLQTPVERPVFVVGIQRSGTTLLQRLLHAAPDAQGLEMWLTQLPQPRPPRETWEDDPVFSLLKAAVDQHHQDNPDLAGIHFVAADMVEEDWQLIRQSMTTEAWVYLAHVPEYAEWLRTADRVPAYERFRRNLQLIGSGDPDKRWVLKNPSHLASLPALFEVFPDALVVQTHRDPLTTVPSACSLSATSTRGWSTTFTGEVIGRTILQQQAAEVAAARAAREHLPSKQVLDVQYDDLVADPIGTARLVHESFDLPWDETVETAITADYEASRSGTRRPRHEYSLADYGLTEDQVRTAFEA
jgi:hypothetical protein